MPHYFTNDPALRSRPRTVAFRVAGLELALRSDEGVFSKRRLDEGSRLLIETILREPLGKRILDLGCGYGPIGIAVALKRPEAEVVLSDVNRRAVKLAAENVRALGLEGRAKAVESDLYAQIDGTFDAIITNPPIRAGKKTLAGIYEGARERLATKGALFLVIRKAQGEASCEAALKELYEDVSTLDKRKGYVVLRAARARREGA